MLNLRENEDHKVYVSSDFHFGHQREFVWKARGHNSVEEHDDYVVESINFTVRPQDTLMFLGDLCLNTPFDKFDALLDRIKCQNIMMLWGNHNNPHEKAVYRKLVPEGERYPVKYKNVTYIGHYVECVLGGQYVILCHYPISVWNEMKNGSWMLCGHSHYSFPESQAENKSSKILDVGWDGHGKPWSLAELASIMATKGIKAVDHHQ